MKTYRITIFAIAALVSQLSFAQSSSYDNLDPFDQRLVEFASLKPATLEQAIGTWDCNLVSRTPSGRLILTSSPPLTIMKAADGGLATSDKSAIGWDPQTSELILTVLEDRGFRLYHSIRAKNSEELVMEYVANIDRDSLSGYGSVSVPGYSLVGFLKCKRSQ